MLEDFTVHTFSEHLGGTFRVHPNGSDPLDLELISATELGEGAGRGRPFSIATPQRVGRREDGS